MRQAQRNPEAVAEATSLLRSQHRSATSRLQKAIDRMTAIAAHPFSVPAIAAFIFAWIGFNSAGFARHAAMFDPPPFFALQGLICGVSLLIGALLVSTQRSEAQLADLRAHLILEMAILAERKSSKAIQLLEEYRRDNPLVADRRDDEARAMAAPADHAIVLSSIHGA